LHNPLNFTFINTISAVSELKEADIKVYPNPAVSYTQVEISKGISNATITLYDMAGRAVKNVELQEGLTTVGLQGIAAGLYHYRVEAENIVVGRGSLVVGR